jgi:hypothetical protein
MANLCKFGLTPVDAQRHRLQWRESASRTDREQRLVAPADVPRPYSSPMLALPSSPIQSPGPIRRASGDREHEFDEPQLPERPAGSR